MANSVKGLITNIQRFSLDDGPGIRTTVFFQGCSLHCAWCHNPETIPKLPVLRYHAALCIGCKACAAVCPNSAHRFSQGIHTINRILCTNCGSCTNVCPADALHLSGRLYTAEELTEELVRDKAFYRNSNGGVTFSGGEPMLQTDFLARVLAGCRRRQLHTAVDTAGNVDWEHFERILLDTDLFLYDIKLISPSLHRECTLVSNARIQDNLLRLIARSAAVLVRIPLIPAFHDDQELEKLAAFLAPLKLQRIELLPYHRYGIGKYEELGQVYTMDCSEPDDAWLKHALAFFSSCRAEVVLNT